MVEMRPALRGRVDRAATQHAEQQLGELDQRVIQMA